MSVIDPKRTSGGIREVAVMDHKDGKAASGTRPAALPSSPIQCRGSHRDAVRALAIGTASDPELGSPLFVSSRHIGIELNRAAWNSTTPYLSVLVAPRLAPTRLVVDPGCRLLLAIMPDRATERSVQRRDPGSDATARQDIRLPAPLVREQHCYFAGGEACGAVQAL